MRDLNNRKAPRFHNVQIQQNDSRQGAKIAKMYENSETMMKRDVTRTVNGLPE